MPQTTRSGNFKLSEAVEDQRVCKGIGKLWDFGFVGYQKPTQDMIYYWNLMAFTWLTRYRTDNVLANPLVWSGYKPTSNETVFIWQRTRGVNLENADACFSCIWVFTLRMFKEKNPFPLPQITRKLSELLGAHNGSLYSLQARPYYSYLWAPYSGLVRVQLLLGNKQFLGVFSRMFELTAKLTHWTSWCRHGLGKFQIAKKMAKIRRNCASLHQSAWKIAIFVLVLCN